MTLWINQLTDNEDLLFNIDVSYAVTWSWNNNTSFSLLVIVVEVIPVNISRTEMKGVFSRQTRRRNGSWDMPQSLLIK